MQVLEEIGAVRVDHTWQLAGSQEIEIWLYQLGVDDLKLEAETYVGLSIHGPIDRIQQIAEAVWARHPS